MRRKKWWLLLPLVLVLAYLMGPRPSSPVYAKNIPVIPTSATALEQFVHEQETQHHLKPDNEARIVWANDSLKSKTAYAIVYLHGFTASQAEGDPVHHDIATRYGCNLYLSRLAEHGIDTTEPLLNLTADKYWESAKQALAIGRQLGNKVILAGTSTGGTLALQLAAAYPEDVAALILMSPNIAINDPNAWMLNKPWGLQIARLVKHSNYIASTDTNRLYKQYWSNPYRIEAAVNLQELVSTTMNEETFANVKQPTLVLYYYKDDVHQDSTVKVSATLKMYEELGSTSKRAVAIPNAGDHVIGSYITSHDVQGVETAIEKFMEEVLKVKPVK
ncbi:MAG: alpha/beta fold hydrolase [Chitinophagaceae bacterium]